MTKYKKPDHVGWDLWQATAIWKQRFTQGMVGHGHTWYAEARGSLMQFLSDEGIAQTTLTERSGLTKQAVQQHLDDLADDGIIRREPDAGDKRRKLVVLTEQGMRALRDATSVKLKIEKEYANALGAEKLDTLKAGLKAIIKLGA
ncbi:MarR family transcriptional regulator [uncultured Roseibium sp.]|uniref:MarR family winged helix-turn-helix transcriptional regulator n=1 Tax=uncultured Roseibium sp. TaxID=1936171 RepID=UPI002621B3A6|nr:MarR family transcriptional regulator [uncultured Roseibium sp.]